MIVSEVNNLVRYRVNQSSEEKLKQINVFFAMHMNTSRLREGDHLILLRGPNIEPFSTFGANTMPKLGFCSFSHSNLSPFVSVGRYCSISWSVNIMGEAHPLNVLTTSTLTYMPGTHHYRRPIEFLGGKGFKPAPPTQKPWPIIENDVWIGQYVLLARGITLGTGCAIGAGSVVTKSVPPYAIVGGNPAKIIRYRFDEKVIEKLLASQWWRYSFTHFSHLNWSNPSVFVDELGELAESGGIAQYNPEKIDVVEFLEA